MFNKTSLKTACVAAALSLTVGSSATGQNYEEVLKKNCSEPCHYKHDYEDLIGDFYRPKIRIELESGRMPLNRNSLNEDSLRAIFDWLDELEPINPDHQILGTRSTSPQEKLRLIRDHLKTIPEKDRQKIIYFTMTRYSEEQEDALRKLINSISWNLELVFPEAVPGSYKTIFFVNRSDLRWGYQSGDRTASYHTWATIMKKYPYDDINSPKENRIPVDYGEPEIYQEIKELTKIIGINNFPDIPIPVVFADWFIANASSAKELYHTILYDDNTNQEWSGDSINTEEKLVSNRLAIKVRDRSTNGFFNQPAKNIIHYSAEWSELYQVGGVQGKDVNDGKHQSIVARYNRILDRIPFKYGFDNEYRKYVYWKSYDFNSSAGTSNIFISGENFNHAGNEMIFTLPNGLHAYFITKRNGQRLEEAPTNIVFDPKENEIINGIGCMRCHSDGIFWFKDELKHQNSKTIDQDLINEYIAQDNENYQGVLEYLSMKPESNSSSTVNSIISVYDSYFKAPITPERAAEILGIEIEVYVNNIRNLFKDDEYSLNLLLYEGGINRNGRNSWEHYFPQIVEDLYKDRPPAAPKNMVEMNNSRVKETVLLQNFPNPFNPETWIPYQLVEPAEVTISIYTIKGDLVRVMELGYQAAGRYENRSRAAYWDGRNQIGERVSTGVYYYALTAGDINRIGKMVVMK